MRNAIVFWMLLAASASAQPLEGSITCTSPVSVQDSAKSLMQRYGDDAAIGEKLSTGVEDITYQGVVLLPQSPNRRIEIGFTDDTMRRVARLTLIDAETRWRVAGVTLGSTLAEVQKINGRPFLIREFFTDGGGFVVDWKGGALSRPLPGGGCFLGVRFGKADETGSPTGDPIASDKANLRKWGPVVEQIVISFPEK